MRLSDIVGETSPIQVMDVGAAAIAEIPVYRKLIDKGLGFLNAFEGDPRHIAKIGEIYRDKARVFNDFLFDGTEQTLYLAHENTGMTSLLKPDVEGLKFFSGFEVFGQVLSTEQVQTRRLDDVDGMPPIDFVKMDIQGSELTVLKNGLHTLRDCLALQLEVSYICLYENQPPFGEVDLWMRENGFVPHCFLDVKKWSISPTFRKENFRQGFNQLIESDIVYIKNPMKLDLFSDEQLKKLTQIAHQCFASVDLCIYLINELVRRGSIDPDASASYVAMVGPQ